MFELLIKNLIKEQKNQLQIVTNLRSVDVDVDVKEKQNLDQVIAKHLSLVKFAYYFASYYTRSPIPRFLNKFANIKEVVACY